MNHSSNQRVIPLSMEEGVHVLLSNAQQGIRSRYTKV